MQYAMDIKKIGDLIEQPAPPGQAWWCIDGTWYEWRQASPTVRATSRRPGLGAVPDEILPLDTPTKAAAKRVVYRHIWPDRR